MSVGMTATRLTVAERLKGFDEVEQAFNPTQATLEANRCLLCDNAPCSQGCPAGIDVRGFIRKIRFGEYRGGVRLLREENIFAGTCGRVCPTEALCEQACRSQALTDPIRIGALQRFLTDWEMAVGRRPFDLPPATLKPVAVIGAGPAGLSAAALLRQLGHPVTVFEKEGYAGGALVNSIPAFKLPRAVVDYEVGLVRDMGVDIRLNTPVDEQRTPQQLLEQGFGAVLLAVGLQESYSLGIPGEELEGVITALEVLRLANGLTPQRPVRIGRDVVVIGGGSASINAACAALRLGAETVTVTALGTPAEMDAFEKDKQQGLEEGIQFLSRVRPFRFLGEGGRVTGVELRRVTWREPGRFTPDNAVDLPAPSLVLLADTVVIAIGQRPDEGFRRCIPELQAAANGCLLVDPETKATSLEGIFAAGDILVGRHTVVQSVAEGKAAARAIHEYLSA
jgi:NADPH-dependent glutamate synthase beta subunit-like oxidoreductase